MWYLVVGPLLGYGTAYPLTKWARQLLAQVPAAEAAPVALAQTGAGMTTVSRAPHLPLTLPRRWAGALRWGLIALTPLALWHGVMGAQHLAPWGAALALTLCMVFLVLAAVIDGATHLIFAEIIALPAGVALLAGLWAGPSIWPTLLIGGAVGGGILGALYLAGQFLYGTDALGWGDVQLGLALGVMLGWPGILRALVWGMLLLVVVTLALLAMRRITTRSFIPLGSFFILGALVALLFAPIPWL